MGDLYAPQKRLLANYTHDGQPDANYESPAMYATSLAYFQFVQPDLAQEIYNTKIISTYSNDTNTFAPELNYYDQNWLWFSLAMFNHDLPNLYAP